MTKFNLFIIVFFTLTSNCYYNNSWSKELVYVKKTFFAKNPKPSISATSTDETTKWFDDFPTAKSDQELEFGFYLPKNYGLSFRNSELNGVHSGEATKYACILGYCSYVGAGIVTGNSATDKISYEIDSWQVILDRLYNLNNTIKVRPRIGVNILDTSLQYSSAGQNVKEKQLAPLPFLGFHSEFKFNDYYSIYIDTNYFKYKETKLELHYYDTAIGINRKINKYLNLVVGYKKYDLGLSNNGGSANISLDIEQKTPFVGFYLSY